MISKQELLKYEELDIMDVPQLPVSQKSKNRLYLCWRNSEGVECKMIGLKPNASAITALKNTNIWTRRGKSLIAKSQNANADASTISLLMAHMISNAFASIPTRNTIASVANARNRNARIAQGL